MGSSYAHTVSDPTDMLTTLQKQMEAVKNSVHLAFDESMDKYLAEYETLDTQARASDPDTPLKYRLTAAKMLVSAAYVYLDTLWMYLKTQGVDPTTHPVHAELERVHSYFAKLKGVSSNTKEKTSQKIDVDAAKRMVHAAASLGKHTRFDEEKSHPLVQQPPAQNDVHEEPVQSAPSKKKKKLLSRQSKPSKEIP